MLGTNRLLHPRGGGVWRRLRGLILKMYKMWGGVEILRHSCQTILWLKQIQIFTFFKIKNFLGGHAPRLPQVCTFKISCFTANYQYLFAYEINAQGWRKKRLGLVELGFRIPIVSGIPDSFSCIPDSKAQDSTFRNQFNKQKCLGFRNPDFLTWGEKEKKEKQLEWCNLHRVSRGFMFTETWIFPGVVNR